MTDITPTFKQARVRKQSSGNEGVAGQGLEAERLLVGRTSALSLAYR